MLSPIKSQVVDRTLGLFWNYPDERTTQSPRIELEDMRAWYLHRTLAGVDYALGDRSQEEVEKLLYASLCYRKSYCGHTSSDFDYAYNLSLFLQQNYPESTALQYFNGIDTLLTAYRSLDWITPLSRFSPTSALNQTRKLSQQVESQHRSYWQPDNHANFQPNYQIFHDNRHEKHAFLWFTPI